VGSGRAAEGCVTKPTFKAKAVVDGHGPCAIVNRQMYSFSATTLYAKRHNTHVEPLVLWQSACGGRDLSKRDYQHLIACTDCETLADEITGALDDIEKTLTAGTFTLTLPKVVQCNDVLARAAKNNRQIRLSELRFCKTGSLGVLPF